MKCVLMLPRGGLGGVSAVCQRANPGVALTPHRCVKTQVSRLRVEGCAGGRARLFDFGVGEIRAD